MTRSPIQGAVYCTQISYLKGAQDRNSYLRVLSLISPPALAMISSHLSVLESSSIKYASATLFRTPKLDSTGRVEEWRSISYKQFLHDVELFARYWTRVFDQDQLPKRSVVGMWYVIIISWYLGLYQYITFRLSGFTYTDVLHIYGISRAGYIPQLFSLRLPNPDVIYELMHRAGAKVIIYDHTFESILDNCPVPKHCALQTERIEDVQASLPGIWDHDENDTVFIFHTSGSTSGSPKLVPMSYRWLNSVVVKSHHISKPQIPDRQDVTVSM